jgi:hypothetical protein
MRSQLGPTINALCPATLSLASSCSRSPLVHALCSQVTAGVSTPGEAYLAFIPIAIPRKWVIVRHEARRRLEGERTGEARSLCATHESRPPPCPPGPHASLCLLLSLERYLWAVQVILTHAASPDSSIAGHIAGVAAGLLQSYVLAPCE